MSFFYAERADKNGNQLLTSYGNLKSAEKYGGADASIVEGLRYAHFSESCTRLRINEEKGGTLVRSYLRNSNPPEGSGQGRYVLWGKTNGQWSETEHRSSSYGTANNLMKSLISAYEALVLLDEGPEPETKEKTSTQSFSYDDL